ncbi:adenylate/guanylate cyclase domain-containing protein [Nodosilinea sp. E11]|uniref:adenylate/guanylate cyclase domain-containing protein n=1 Tax=Nodosilinea sp. E11 TaxID=3037479 RepID=UPI0029341288|nr:adenylate/guanylate cyclase domain-containing protein [Nodosilinea sp. E11]WOD41082.1 adenylate/guanylate cyclase domain-containing protein [Nodosilinea sp. E11]
MDDASAAIDLVIVDDDAETSRLLNRLLSQQGYCIQTAESGQQALDLVAKRQPGLVMLDILLPDMDGYTLCRQLKNDPLTTEIPVIVLSSLVDPLDKVKAFQAGATDYITKPFAVQEVLVRVQNQLHLARQRQQLSRQNALLTQELQERTQMEQTLVAAETSYQSIFENATVGIFKVSSTGRLLSVNPSMARLYGYESPEEMVSTIEDIGRQIYHQPKRRDELVVYLNRFDKITDAESEVFRKDGDTFWVSEDIWKVWDKNGTFLHYEGIVHDISERRKMETELRQQRQQADRLLINILPYRIAQRLKGGARTIAESLDQVSVLFADLVDFTAASSQMTPRDLVKILNEIFSMFDQLAEFHHLEKIKTIGDAYMVAGGLPTPNDDHAEAIAQFALDICDAIKQFPRPDGQTFQIRVGINTGPVVAGVIGRRKFAYDLWGDTVNIASRMEATGEAQRIQVTPNLYEKLKDKYQFESRGYVAVKGRGQMVTYWLVGRL